MLTAKENKMVVELRERFAGVERIPLSAADRLFKILDAAPEAALAALVRERVKFCAMPAANRLRRDHGWNEDRLERLMKGESDGDCEA